MHLKRISLIRCTALKLLCALLLLFPCLTVATAKNFKVAYVALQINTEKGSDFYQILMSKRQQPYVNLYSLLSLLEFKVSCDKKHYCLITQKANHLIYWIDFNNQRYGEVNKDKKQTTGRFKAIAINKQNNKIWLNYQLLSDWLPVSIHWDEEKYSLNIRPEYQLAENLKKQHHIDVQGVLSTQKKQQDLLKSKALTPKRRFNSALRYLLTYNYDTKTHDNQSLAIDNNTDLFGGTLNITGSAERTQADTSFSTPDWNYTKQDQMNNNKLQLGTVFSDNNASLLMPSLVLKDTLSYQRYTQPQASKHFVFHGQSLPGTEIDVWRNNFLRKVIHVDSSGVFTIRDDQAQGGDHYVLKFYLPDGSYYKKEFTIADNSDFTLPKQHWNVGITSGRLNGETDNSGRYSSANIGYGLTDNFSTYLETYKFPLQASPNSATGIKLLWQAKSWLNVLYQNLFYEGAHDDAWTINFTGLNQHEISLSHRRLASNSPIFKLNLSPKDLLPYFVPFAYSTDNARKWWVLSDNFNIQDYRFILSYQQTNVDTTSFIQVDKQINSIVDLQAYLGTLAYNDQVSEPWASYNASLNLPGDSYLSLQQTWVRDNRELGGTTLNYSYYILDNGQQDLSLSVNATSVPGEKILWGLAATKQINNNFNVGINLNDTSVMANVSFGQILGLAPHPQNPNQFGTGTLVGRVMAPNANGKPQPLANTKIACSGITVKSDQQGYYKIPGISTDTDVIVAVDDKSLPASLALVNAEKVLYFRPSTVITFNPKIEMTVGLDGQLLKVGGIKPGQKLQVVNARSKKIVKTVAIEKGDGFFLVENLLPGHYQLQLSDHKHPIKPLDINITEQQHWISDIKWHWQRQAKHASQQPIKALNSHA